MVMMTTAHMQLMPPHDDRGVNAMRVRMMMMIANPNPSCLLPMLCPSLCRLTGESSPSHTPTAQFHSLCVDVPVRRKGGPQDMRCVLDSACGVVLPGQLLSVMGSSGSGKSTLLSALAGHLPRGARLRTGSVLQVNDIPLEGGIWERVCGYVRQDDFLLHYLTVRETLQYAARFQLPTSMSSREKDAMVTLRTLPVFPCTPRSSW